MQTFEQEFNRILAKFDAENEQEDSKPFPEEEPKEFDVYIEPDRITVVKRPEPQEQVFEAVQPPQTPPQTKPIFAYVAMTVSLLLVCYLVTSAFITTFFPPTVTITLLIKSQTVKATGTLQLPAREVPPITLSQSQTIPTTGRGHQDARSANGYITFYNGEFQNVTIPAGKALTGSSGVTIITDQDAVIPAANLDPPTFGQVTVSAHAINPGSNGNISAYDINTPCCLASVIAKNQEHFTGGQDEQDFKIATKSDIAGLTATLKTNLSQSMQAALQSQLQSGEALIMLTCTPTATSDHRPGQEATEVKVTVSETCSAVAYNQDTLQAKVMQLLTTQATKKLGSGYSILGNPDVNITQASAQNTKIVLSFNAQSTWIYALSSVEQNHIKKIIAGKTKETATQLLNRLSGIERVSLESSGFADSSRIPKDISYINLVLYYGF